MGSCNADDRNADDQTHPDIATCDIEEPQQKYRLEFIIVALLFYVHGKHLRSCRDGQLT